MKSKMLHMSAGVLDKTNVMNDKPKGVGDAATKQETQTRADKTHTLDMCKTLSFAILGVP